MGVCQRGESCWQGWQRCREGVPGGKDVVCEAVARRLEGIGTPWFTTCEAQEGEWESSDRGSGRSAVHLGAGGVVGDKCWVNY